MGLSRYKKNRGKMCKTNARHCIVKKNSRNYFNILASGIYWYRIKLEIEIIGYRLHEYTWRKKQPSQ